MAASGRREALTARRQLGGTGALMIVAAIVGSWHGGRAVADVDAGANDDADAAAEEAMDAAAAPATDDAAAPDATAVNPEAGLPPLAAPPTTAAPAPPAEDADGADPYQTVVRAQPSVAPRTSLAEVEARTTPGALGDPLRVLESLPGVSPIVWPLAVYSVRGANPGNTGFFLDGMRIPTQFHFLLGPSVIHPYFIGGLDFYPGAYPAAYGRFISGIVTVESRTPPADRAHVEVDARLYDTGALVAAPFDDGKGTVAAAARFSYTGLLLSALSSDVSVFYADYQLRVDHPLGPGQLSLLALGSFDTLQLPPISVGHSPERRGETALQFHRVRARWMTPLGRARVELALALGLDRSQTELLSTPLHVRSLASAPRAQLTWPSSAGRVELQAGADAELEHLTPDTPSELFLAGDIARRRDAAALGVWLAATWRPSAHLALTPAFRFDEYWEEGVARAEPGPRLFVRAPLSPRLTLTAAGGRFSQMPSLPVSTGSLEAFGLASLGTQTSWQGSVGAEVQVNDSLHLETTGFFQRMRLSDLSSLMSFDPQRPDFLAMRNGNGYGVEVLVRRSFERRLHGWISYTLSRSTRDFDGVTGPSDWDQRHLLNIVAGRRLGRAVTVGARFHYGSGRPAPIAPPGQSVQYRNLPAFYQLDLRGERRFVFDRFVLDAYLEIVNATLTRNVVGYDSLSATPQPQEVGFRVFLPSLGVHAVF